MSNLRRAALLLTGLVFVAGISAVPVRVDPDIFDGSRRPKSEPHPALEAAASHGIVPRGDAAATSIEGRPAGGAAGDATQAQVGGTVDTPPQVRAGAETAATATQAGADSPGTPGISPPEEGSLPEAPAPVAIGDPTAMIRIAQPVRGVREPVGMRPDPAAAESPGDRLDPLQRPAGAQNPNEVRGGVDPGATVPPHL